ncbi:MAG: transcription-repair coupling factor [Ruminiclostridium sp.]|nr:transcription-repair coupling factor [Ruminiclostridium sp.]
MEIFKNMAEGLGSYRRSVKHILSEEPVPMLVTGFSHVHKAHFLAAMAQSDDVRASLPILCIVESEAAAVRMCEDINTLCGKRAAYQFPAADMILTDTEAQSAEYSHRRIEALSAAAGGRADIIVASSEASLQLTVPMDVLREHTFVIESGAELDTAELSKKLISAGYSRCELIEGKGQFSIRGSLVDIYPVNSEQPIRAELWGDEVDTVSTFDIETQRRTDSIDRAEITPCFETVFYSNEELIEKLSVLLQKAEKSKKKNEELVKRLRRDIARLSDNVGVGNLYRYFPLCYEKAGSVFDYAKTLVVCEGFASMDNAKGVCDSHNEDLKLLAESGFICKGLDRYLFTKGEYKELIEKNTRLYMDTFVRGGGLELSDIQNVDAVQLSPWSGEYKVLCEELKDYIDRGYSCVVYAGTEKAAKILAGDLRESGLPADFYQDAKKLYAKKIYVLAGTLSAGFEYKEEKIAAMTRSQGAITKTPVKPRKFKKGQQIRSLGDISLGDLIVHESHGIGVFDGVQKMTADGVQKDYIKLKYAGTDVLYIPVTHLDMISRYIGTGDVGTVKLNKLHTDTWKKAKAKAKTAAKEMATELIELYSKRMKAQGFAFSPDGEQQHIFDDHFNYIETDDQLRCIEEIKHDMMRTAPMERLLCGDVGFGKTEVALRAAFKCFLDGKQCAILVPTTVLAWQHYQTVLKRMEGFKVKVQLLSRFRSAKEQKQILKQLEEGDIDIIIGTHRLVQDDVKFFDLGLAIIDEEQRFGVNHKEKFKQNYNGIDILTLSATPIPRTLNMAMTGIRDMSVIETPPGDRQPITTYVIEHDKGVIAQAINKELRRNGQVYYLHNRVSSIYSCAASLQEMIPEARIGVAHGKMGEEELLEVWRKLIDAEIDILVCTTIIETGVDVPNCNTLIIENADNMGLAQLHQLRGRVGRTNRRAYAYFTFKRGKVLSEIATKRLDAIREFTKFGSGFRIAMKDLEIRGAGSVLGQSQSGHLATVGYDMYVKLLTEAVMEQQGKAPEIRPECLVDIKIDAYIPESYISSPGQRIDCYRKIALIETEEDATDVLDELIDRYGDVPRAVVGLVKVAKYRHMAQDMHITEIIQSGDFMLFYPEEVNEKSMERISLVAEKFGKNMTLNLTGKANFKVKMDKKATPLDVMKDVLTAMKGKDV